MPDQISIPAANGYMLDTNVFDVIHDTGLEDACLRSGWKLFVTQVQISEIRNIPNATRREALLGLMERLAPKKLLLRSGVWIDELHWDDDQPWIDDVTPDYVHFVGNAIIPPSRDAMIGDVTKHNCLVLVSNDGRLLRRAIRAGLSTMETSKFVNAIQAT